MKPTLCVGFDNNGKAFWCPNLPGTPWTDVWCAECDERRRARLTNRFVAALVGNGK